MIAIKQTRIATPRYRIGNWLFGYRTAKGDYDAKMKLIDREFNEISRLCFVCDVELPPDDWRVLDEARLNASRLSFAEVRARLKEIYRRIQRACVEKGVAYAQREA